MASKYVSTFRAPTEYELALERARKQKALAEALAQQEYTPMEGVAAPIPRAAPLVKALQGYLTARAGRKAEEAEAEAKGMETRAGEQIAGRVFGGAPVRDVDTTPDESGLAEVAIQSQYRQSPQDALRMASTPQGAAALRGNPALAAALQKSMEAPKTAEFGTNPQFDADGRAFVVNKAGEVRYLDGIRKPADAPAAVTPVTIRKGGRDIVIDARTGAELGNAPVAPRDEPLMSIVGPDGKPILARRSQAEGKQPFFATTAGGTQLTGDDKVDRRKHREKRQELQNAYNSVLGFVQELKNTPKEESLFGEKAGRLAAKYKLALGAVRVLQNTGVLNVGEMPFIEDTLRDPQSISQLFNPSSRAAIGGQIDSILDLLEGQAVVNDEVYGYDVTPLKGRELRGEKIPAAAVKAGLTQADWDAATEEEKAAWR